MLKETKLLWGKREDLHIDASLVKRQNGRVRANYQFLQWREITSIQVIEEQMKSNIDKYQIQHMGNSSYSTVMGPKLSLTPREWGLRVRTGSTVNIISVLRIAGAQTVSWMPAKEQSAKQRHILLALFKSTPCLQKNIIERKIYGEGWKGQSKGKNSLHRRNS